MTYLDEIAAAIRDALPDDAEYPQNADDLFVLYAVLARARGERTSARDVHDAWSAWMRTKDPSHESLVPFEDLPAKVQSEDTPFVRAIRAVAAHADQCVDHE